jgi:heme exporter protein CcmD
MSLGPYTSFVVTSYLAVALEVTVLIAWIVFDYANQMRRLRELDAVGVARRSGRSTVHLA